MHIWIDLANAPHVNFFKPIIEKLLTFGHTVSVSIRAFNQTPELAELAGISGIIIGKHGGKGNLRKLFNLCHRSILLILYCRKMKFNIAASHNSYAQTVAARFAGVYSVTFMDYEGQPANHISFRTASRIVVPDCFTDIFLKKFGVNLKNVYKYIGFKEQLYLSNFKPDKDFYDSLRNSCKMPDSCNPEKQVLVTVRTPASLASYHTFNNKIFHKLLQFLDKRGDLCVVVLPRYPAQKSDIQSNYPTFFIPDTAISGTNLIYFSDLVISGGGTMNREAAILGTPVYTIFGGVLPAVDKKLIRNGRMLAIHNEADFSSIPFKKKNENTVLANPMLCDELCRCIMASSL